MAEPPSVLTAVAAAAGFGPPMVDHLKSGCFSLGAVDYNIVLFILIHSTVICDILYTIKWLSPIIPRALCFLDWHEVKSFLEKQSQREINSFKSNRIEHKIIKSLS
jgi:hypothetical protein